MADEKIPSGTEFILTVPIKRDKSETATFYLKDIDEVIYMAAKGMIDKRQDLEAVKFIIRNLSLPGSDAVEKLNFIGAQAASPKILELITPMDAELKKN